MQGGQDALGQLQRHGAVGQFAQFVDDEPVGGPAVDCARLGLGIEVQDVDLVAAVGQQAGHPAGRYRSPARLWWIAVGDEE